MTIVGMQQVRIALVSVFAFISTAIAAAPMTFRPGGNDIRFCPESCDFIQASGDIVESTPADFEKLLADKMIRGGHVRLNSSGGSLAAGLKLGEIFRKRGFVTEVGADEPDPKLKNYDGTSTTRRVPGSCSSACAYAYLGGVKRVLVDGDRLGFHRFYRQAALEAPDEKLFRGEDLDATQRVTAGLALYMVRMGVDAALLGIADEAPPDQMRWISVEEAGQLRVTFNPDAWKPWRIETFRGGVLAISEQYDGKSRMVASCTRKRGPQLVLTMTKDGAGDWLDRCRDSNDHPVLGEVVTVDKAEFIRLPNGGGSIRFRLPNSTPKLTSAGLFEHSTAYPTACSSMGLGGSSVNMTPAIRTALRNCFSD